MRGITPPTPSIRINGDTSSSPPLPPLSPPKTSVSHFLVREESGHRSVTSLSSRSVPSVTEYASSEDSAKDTETVPSTNELAPRTPSQTTHFSQTDQIKDSESPLPPLPPPEQTHIPEAPSYEDLYDFSRFEPKPKVKLGPRPVTEKPRRQNAASVAAIPASIKPAPKKVEIPRPKSQGPVHAPPVILPTPPPIPMMPEYTPRPLSRGSVKSLPSHKSTAMTPDKIRLMKAVELRKRQMRKSNPPPEAPAVLLVTENAPKVPKIPVMADSRQNQLAEKEAESGAQAERHSQGDSKKADSGIEMNYDRPDRHEDPSPVTEEPATKNEKPFSLPDLPPAAPIIEQRKPPTLDTFRPSSYQHLDTPEMQYGPATPQELPKPPKIGDSLFSDSPTLGRKVQHDEQLDQRHKDEPEAMTSREFVASLPTVVMADGSLPQSASGQPVLSAKSSTADLGLDDKSSDEGLRLKDKENPARNARRVNSDLQKKRRGFVEPLHIDVGPGAPEDQDYWSDDDFMAELQSATLQQAKPISVAKSPAAPFFQRRPSANSMQSAHSVTSVKSVNIVHRSSSNPSQLERFSVVPDRLSPELPQAPTMANSFQSVSLPKTSELENSDPLVGPRRSPSGLTRHVSSDISRRIATLAEVSSREPSLHQSTSPSRPMTPDTSPNSSTAVQKPSLRSPPRSRATSITKQQRRTSGKTGVTPLVSPTFANENSYPVWNVRQDSSSQRDSVSVTARIVRPKSNATSDLASPPESAPLELQQSPIMINHNRAVPSPISIPPFPNPPAAKSDSAALLASQPSLSPTIARTSVEGTRQLHSASRRSFGRHRRPEPTEDAPPAPTSRTTSSSSLASNEEKEGTRTSRFFKRMSAMGHNKRKSIAQTMSSNSSPSSPLEHRGGSFARDKSDMPPSAVVGDLNVQFPDTLLWKRRWVEVDNSGYLVLSIPQAMDHQRGVARKFHLSEFKRPYAPDLDRQELPYSVLLDFVDGTTLQAACEDSMTQGQVLSSKHISLRACRTLLMTSQYCAPIIRPGPEREASTTMMDTRRTYHISHNCFSPHPLCRSPLSTQCTNVARRFEPRSPWHRHTLILYTPLHA